MRIWPGSASSCIAPEQLYDATEFEACHQLGARAVILAAEPKPSGK